MALISTVMSPSVNSWRIDSPFVIASLRAQRGQGSVLPLTVSIADLSLSITPAFGYFMQVCGRFPLNPVFFIYIDESEVNTFEHHVLGFSCIFQFLFCFDEFPFVLFHLGNIPTGNQQQMTMTMGYDGFIYNRIMQNTIRGYVIFFYPVIFPLL